jgi:hypothetical protein
MLYERERNENAERVTTEIINTIDYEVKTSQNYRNCPI